MRFLKCAVPGLAVGLAAAGAIAQDCPGKVRRDLAVSGFAELLAHVRKQPGRPLALAR